MKLLITGGYGNLGAWLVRYFSQNTNFEIFVLARSKKNILDNYPHQFIQCDLSVLEDCKIKLANHSFEYVIHAGSVNDTFLENYANQALLVNTLGTRNLLESINKAALNHFIYLSTFHVYGAVEGFITELNAPAPKHDYATTHLFAELYVKQFHLTHQLPYTIIRLSNSYGCPLDTNSSKWYLILNDLAKMAFTTKKIILKSNGLASRDFIWMGSVCEVFDKLLKLDIAPNNTFNLSAEKSYKLFEIATYVQSAAIEYLHLEIPVEINMNDTSVPSNNLVVSSAKLHELINYTPENKFVEEAVEIFKLLKR